MTKAMSNETRARGRQFYFNPGPTNIPDSVLSAMNRPAEDFLTDTFKAVLRRAHTNLKQALGTKQHLLLFGANGHSAWEAALANVFSPGDKILMLESGYFSYHWTKMATDLGLEVETLWADWRKGVPVVQVAERLAADRTHEIKGVLVVHNETATGLVHPLAELRGAIDGAKHPALFLVDTISSFASMDFHFDELGIDIAVGGSQKGLMMITGLSFTAISERALEISKTGGLRRSFFDWGAMMTVEPQRFPGTSPVHLIYGLDEALRLLLEEGMDNVVARHARFANAARAAVRHWGDGAMSDARVSWDSVEGEIDGIQILCTDPDRLSDSVTAVFVPDGHDANAMRRIALDRYNLSLGQGLGPLAGRLFRIGHLGDMNEPMMLGALATIELSLKAAGIPHKYGGVDAAIAALAA
jgi:alanine-glyoxylate transaminase / serine-glyoxylate transaminase / serine-pyruvate transaminase